MHSPKTPEPSGAGVFVLSILDPLLDPKKPYNLKKDSSHLLLLALSKRGYSLFTADPSGLFFYQGKVCVRATAITVLPKKPYFQFHKTTIRKAEDFSLIWMRKDPPVDTSYLYATQLLSLLKKPLVINHPKSLREWNEKLVILKFPQWIPETLVASQRNEINDFIHVHRGMVLLKPLHGFAGKGVKKIKHIARSKNQPVMLQEFLPGMRHEKRVFLVGGKILGALLKLPKKRFSSTKLTWRETKICKDLCPFLKKNGIFFAGVDLIDEKLIEINITSPGLLWEWNEVDKTHHEEEIIDLLEKKLK